MENDVTASRRLKLQFHVIADGTTLSHVPVAPVGVWPAWENSMHPLDGPRLRVQFAHFHLQHLRSEMDRVCDINAKSVTHDYQSQAGECVVRAKVSQPPSPYWPVRVGNIAHDLRSALDGVAHQVALLKVPHPWKRTQFPIFLSADALANAQNPEECFNKTGIKKHLRDVPDKSLEVFERHQPYAGEHGGKKDPLFLLQKLNDTDKHRLLPVVMMVAKGVTQKLVPIRTKGGLEAYMGPGTSRAGIAFEDGAEISRFRGVRGEVLTELRLEVCFGDGPDGLKGRPVAPSLDSMIQRVAGIVHDFESMFSN